MIKVFYDKRQTVDTNRSVSPSAQKPGLVMEAWLKLNVPFEVMAFNPVSREDLKRIHSSEYVDGVLGLREPNGFGNTSLGVANALPYVCGSMVAAAVCAYQTQTPSFSPTSGAHHALYNRALSYCTFNFLVLAALAAKDVGANKILILDLDYHYGNGTDNIINHCGFSFIDHFSFGKERNQKSAVEWLNCLPFILKQYSDVNLIIYNAGVDAHIDDPLGGLFTTAELMQRDLIVFREARRLGIPIVTTLAGGYKRDDNGTTAPTIELHCQTLKACNKIYSESN